MAKTAEAIEWNALHCIVKHFRFHQNSEDASQRIYATQLW